MAVSNSSRIFFTDYLVKKYVSNNEKVDDTKVRQGYGMLSCVVGIVVNTIICCAKIAIGYLTGSIAIVSDGLHNLADSGASIISMMGIKLSAKPADHEHPFGHGRLEYLTSLFIGGMIAFIGLQLLMESVEKIINGGTAESSMISVMVLTVSVCLQIWLGLFNRGIGKLIHSQAILAAAKDTLSDSVATIAVIGVQLLNMLAGYDFDAWAGILVAGFIIHSGWEVIDDTVQLILGNEPDPAVTRGIRSKLLQEKSILSVHDLVVHDYGPGRKYISLHADIPANMGLIEAHNIINRLENELEQDFTASVTIHVDPVVIDDPVLNGLKANLFKVLNVADPLMNAHDVRLLEDGTLSFDVCASYGCSMSDEDIRSFIIEGMEQLAPNVKISMKIDRLG